MVTYKLRFIDSVWFMVSSLSSLADNFSEVLHNSKCKVFKSCLEFIKFKNKLIFNQNIKHK